MEKTFVLVLNVWMEELFFGQWMNKLLSSEKIVQNLCFVGMI